MGRFVRSDGALHAAAFDEAAASQFRARKAVKVGDLCQALRSTRAGLGTGGHARNYDKGAGFFRTSNDAASSCLTVI
jgi:hypothetical protein